MPRDGSGVFSAPAGTKGVSGQVIEAAKQNAWVDDLVAEMNAARPIVAGGSGASDAANARANLGAAGLPFANRAAAIAATVPATVDRIAVLTETGRTLIYARDASGTALSTNGGTVNWSPEAPIASPAHWGAADDGTGDSSAAIKSCFDYVSATYTSSLRGFARVMDGLDGHFRLTSSVDMTEMRQPGMTIRNIHFVTATGLGSPGNPALDFHGTNQMTFVNVSITGEAGGQTFVGLGYGRGASGAISPNWTFINFRVDGEFTGTPVLNYGSEVGDFYGLEIKHRSREVGRVMIIADNLTTVNAEIGSYTSAHTTLPSAATNQSTLQNVMMGARLECHSDMYMVLIGVTQANPAVVSFNPAHLTQPLANGDKVFIKAPGMASVDDLTHTVANLNTGAGTFELSGVDTTSDSAFSSGEVRYATGGGPVFAGTKRLKANGYILLYNSTLPAITLDTKNGGTLIDFELDFQIESNAAQPIKWVRDASGTEVMQDCFIRLTNQGQTTAINIIHSDGAGDIRCDGFTLDISNMSVAPSAKIFDAPGDFDLRRARIEVPLAAALHAPTEFKLFSGEMVAYDRAPYKIEYQPASSWTASVHDAASGGNTGTASNLIGGFSVSGGRCNAWVKLVNIDTTGMTAGNDFYIDLSNLWSKLGLAAAPAVTGSFNFFVGTVVTSQVTYADPLAFEWQEGTDRGRIAESQVGGGATDYLTVSQITDDMGDLTLQLEFQMT